MNDEQFNALILKGIISNKEEWAMHNRVYNEFAQEADHTMAYEYIERFFCL